MDSSEPLSKGQGCEAQLTSDRDRRASAIQSCRSPRSAIGRDYPFADVAESCRCEPARERRTTAVGMRGERSLVEGRRRTDPD
jgi:hypothetical protein